MGSSEEKNGFDIAKNLFIRFVVVVGIYNGLRVYQSRTPRNHLFHNQPSQTMCDENCWGLQISSDQGGHYISVRMVENVKAVKQLLRESRYSKRIVRCENILEIGIISKRCNAKVRETLIAMKQCRPKGFRFRMRPGLDGRASQSVD